MCVFNINIRSSVLSVWNVRFWFYIENNAVIHAQKIKNKKSQMVADTNLKVSECQKISAEAKFVAWNIDRYMLKFDWVPAHFWGFEFFASRIDPV